MDIILKSLQPKQFWLAYQNVYTFVYHMYENNIKSIAQGYRGRELSGPIRSLNSIMEDFMKES
jgi:hypothetical protein